MNSFFAEKKEVLEILGHISLAFSGLDFFLTSATYRLLGSRVVSDIGFEDSTTLGQKVKLLKKKSDVILGTDLSSILPELEKVAEERNRFLHDLIVLNESDLEKGFVTRIRVGWKDEFNIGCAKLKEEQVAISQLRNFRGRVVAIQEKVREISKKYIPIERSRIQKTLKRKTNS